MKVAIALDAGSKVSQHFGRTSHYLIATVENSQVVARDMRNPLKLHLEEDCSHSHSHDTDHKHSDILRLLSDCSAVICGGIGPRAVRDLQAKGVVVYTTDQTDPEAALRFLLSGVLAVASPDRSCQCHEQS